MELDEVTRAAENAWKTLKRLVLDGVDDPSSALRSRIADSVMAIGETLRDDAELRDKVDGWIIRGAQHLVTQYGSEATTISTGASSYAQRSAPAGVICSFDNSFITSAIG